MRTRFAGRVMEGGIAHPHGWLTGSCKISASPTAPTLERSVEVVGAEQKAALLVSRYPPMPEAIPPPSASGSPKPRHEPSL
jgi:hypothetical protein